MENDRIKQINTLFSDWDTTTSPGCSLTIIQNGRVIFKNGYGMANLEHQITNKPDSVFYIASVSKQFAACCIALLAEQGKLSIEDDVRQYIPELPDYGQTISIGHMIHHTSGLRDFLELNFISGRNFDELITDEDAMNLITHQQVLNFLPGERFLYCNSGYFLLSQIVKRVSGKSMRQFAEENIFKPLGMKNSHFHDSYREPVPFRATGYSPTPDNETGYFINVPGLETVGSGGIYSTVEDLYLWDQNFYRNVLGEGNQKLIEQMLTPGTFNDGSQQDYAFGLFVSEQNGIKKVRHSGGYGGYSGEFLQFPEKEFSVICLSNCSSLRAPEMAARVAEIFLPELADAEKENTSAVTDVPAITLPSKQLQKYCGLFYSSDSEVVVKISSDSKGLQVEYMGHQLPLTCSRENTFLGSFDSIGLLLAFEKELEKVQLTLGRREPDTLKRITPVKTSPSVLEELFGEYFSQEVRGHALLSIDQESKNLKLKLGRHSFVLDPGTADMFQFSEGTLFIKRENSSQKVTGFELNSGRVKNIRFEKI